MKKKIKRPPDLELFIYPDEDYVRKPVQQKEPAETTEMRLQAAALLQQGKINRAYDAYMTLKETTTHNYPELNGVGIALAAKSMWPQASRVLNRAAKAAPDDPVSRHNRIIALMNIQPASKLVRLVGRPDSGLSYELGSIIMRRFANSDEPKKVPRLQTRVKWFRQLLRNLGLPMDRKLISNYIFANTHHPQRPWREKALDESSDEEIARWVSWSGLDRLQEYNAAGTGVILLHSHFAAQRVATILLAKRGIALHSLEYRQRLADFGVRGAEAITVYELADQAEFALREVYQAQKALKQGSNLKIAGDGVQGKSAVTVDFLGKQRVFKSGFAELALLSKAPVLPVFCSVALSGRISIEILPALDAGEDGLPREERVERLIRQYAGLLEERWRRDPSNITYDHIRKFIDL